MVVKLLRARSREIIWTTVQEVWWAGSLTIFQGRSPENYLDDSPGSLVGWKPLNLSGPVRENYLDDSPGSLVGWKPHNLSGQESGKLFGRQSRKFGGLEASQSFRAGVREIIWTTVQEVWWAGSLTIF